MGTEELMEVYVTPEISAGKEALPDSQHMNWSWRICPNSGASFGEAEFKHHLRIGAATEKEVIVKVLWCLPDGREVPTLPVQLSAKYFFVGSINCLQLHDRNWSTLLAPPPAAPGVLPYVPTITPETGVSLAFKVPEHPSSERVNGTSVAQQQQPVVWVVLDAEECPRCHRHVRCEDNVMCDKCGRASHLSCEGLKKVPKGHWACFMCNPKMKKPKALGPPGGLLGSGQSPGPGPGQVQQVQPKKRKVFYPDLVSDCNYPAGHMASAASSHLPMAPSPDLIDNSALHAAHLGFGGSAGPHRSGTPPFIFSHPHPHPHLHNDAHGSAGHHHPHNNSYHHHQQHQGGSGRMGSPLPSSYSDGPSLDLLIGQPLPPSALRGALDEDASPGDSPGGGCGGATSGGAFGSARPAAVPPPPGHALHGMMASCQAVAQHCAGVEQALQKAQRDLQEQQARHAGIVGRLNTLLEEARQAKAAAEERAAHSAAEASQLREALDDERQARASSETRLHAVAEAIGLQVDDL